MCAFENNAETIKQACLKLMEAASFEELFDSDLLKYISEEMTQELLNHLILKVKSRGFYLEGQLIEQNVKVLVDSTSVSKKAKKNFLMKYLPKNSSILREQILKEIANGDNEDIKLNIQVLASNSLIMNEKIEELKKLVMNQWKESKQSWDFIKIKSSSSEHDFRLFIVKEKVSEQIYDGFSCYGLSATATIPDF